ncbi:MAG: regulatory protein RecX [Proteobacteria bacterium]|nr:regulatory protein RecX [Pseudomonadota bacterium]
MTLRRPRTPPTPDEAADPARARTLALGLLARRDFATGELREALEKRGCLAGVAEGVVGELAEEGLLNESRYVENYVSWHAGRGQGPVRIAADLRRQGVPDGLIAASIAARDDWVQLAAKACRTKFGGRAPKSWPEKARQMRFLQYRGFSADHIRAAVGADPELD